MILRSATKEDIPFIREVYHSTLAGRQSTADTEPLTDAQWENWFADHSAVRPVFIAMIDGSPAGYLSFRDFYGRPAYQGTAEISIYIHTDHRGTGLGREMLRSAIAMARGLGIHTLLGFVFAHNEVSLHLCKSMGFSEWGHLPDIALMDGKPYSLKILGLRVDENAPDQ